MNLYLFNLIEGLSKYSLVVHIAIFFSNIFIYLLPIILIIWIIFYQKRKMYTFSILLLSSVSTWFLAELIKNLTAIKRPVILNPIIVENGFSFPSQHSALMMAVAVVLFSLNKKFGVFVLAMALLVGISRVALGVHFPIDVFAGWILGALVGFIFIKIFKKI